MTPQPYRRVRVFAASTEDGHHGWVPEKYIRITDGRNGVALRDYDSSHLTVATGEELDVLDRVDDYLLCRNEASVDGWVPASCVEEMEEER